MSRVTRTMRGGSQKVTNDDEGEGVRIPPKNDDVIYEQPLIQEVKIKFNIFIVNCHVKVTFASGLQICNTCDGDVNEEHLQIL